MSSLPGTPPLNHPDRGLFERYTKSDDTLIHTSLANDHRLAVLRGVIEKNPETDLHGELHRLESHAQAALEKSDKENTGSWNDHYRLVTQTAFLRERALAPFIFSHAELQETRQKVADGTYGISGRILSEQLLNFDNAHTSAEAEEVRGAIQEQTFIALINRPQDGVHLALPADTSDDLARNIDINLWQATGEGPTLVPIQVKSSFHQSNRAPSNGVIVTAGIMRNAGNNFPVSHLIIKELDGETLSGQDQATLSRARQQTLTTASRARGTLHAKINLLGTLLHRMNL